MWRPAAGHLLPCERGRRPQCGRIGAELRGRPTVGQDATRTSGAGLVRARQAQIAISLSLRPTCSAAGKIMAIKLSLLAPPPLQQTGALVSACLAKPHSSSLAPPVESADVAA